MKALTPITWFDTIDSTNSEARRRAESAENGNIDNMSVYAARFQTAGRGQRGNKWTSAAGENLTFSILLYPGKGGNPNVNAIGQFCLSIVSSLSVIDFLSSKNVQASIKWPNDIYVRNKKVCGMLIENSLSGTEVSSSIIGIGLNLNQTSFSPELMNPTSLYLITGTRNEPETALEEFMEIFQKNLSMLESAEMSSSLKNRYLDKLYRYGKEESYHDCINDEDFKGTIKGISEEGLLLMEMPDKSVRRFAFKELSYII
jgi:BirA family transcriptional regulator, biotin operon repressor / biotin---[acetyl-CoA-carboxylase] ligase